MSEYDYMALANEVTARGISLFEDREEWRKGAFALSNLGEDGKHIFHAISALSPKYNRRENEYHWNDAVRNNRRIGIGTFVWQCKQAGIDTTKYYINDGNDRRTERQYSPTKSVERPQPQPTKICTIPTHYVIDSLDLKIGSSFVASLCRVLNDVSLIEDAAYKYALGITKDGACIFWLIDEQGRVRSGKIMAYDYAGNRIKDKGRKDKIDWCHSRLQKQGKLPPKPEWEMSQCLFGAHLLNPVYENEGKTVALVESEKTAVIGSIEYPQYVWVSCGGKHNLFAGNKLEVLRGRKVLAFPDASEDGSCYASWKSAADELNGQGYDIRVSDLMERVATEEEKKKGIDVADLIKRCWKKKYIKSPIEYVGTEQDEVLQAMIDANPCVGLLVEKLGLEIVTDEPVVPDSDLHFAQHGRNAVRGDNTWVARHRMYQYAGEVS